MIADSAFGGVRWTSELALQMEAFWQVLRYLPGQGRVNGTSPDKEKPHRYPKVTLARLVSGSVHGTTRIFQLRPFDAFFLRSWTPEFDLIGQHGKKHKGNGVLASLSLNNYRQQQYNSNLMMLSFPILNSFCNEHVLKIFWGNAEPYWNVLGQSERKANNSHLDADQ